MAPEKNEEKNEEHARLSDLILKALNLSLDQKDLGIAEALTKALELAMTRNAGGGDFVERRSYPPEIESAMQRLSVLRGQTPE